MTAPTRIAWDRPQSISPPIRSRAHLLADDGFTYCGMRLREELVLVDEAEAARRELCRLCAAIGPQEARQAKRPSLELGRESLERV